MKHVILYSGGHSSALVAIEVANKYGKENCILLNHNISTQVEDKDIKRFKEEVAIYLKMAITYANHDDYEALTPLKLCVKNNAFKYKNNQAVCTSQLKTEPLKLWLKENDATKVNIYYYGFDRQETSRIQRRSSIMGAMGYKTDYPLAFWKERTIHNTTEVGIMPPLTYSSFKHANCTGCLKAGWQHWYIIYCLYPDLWQEAKEAEAHIGYAIHIMKNAPIYLEEKEPLFFKMKQKGIKPTEKINFNAFWSNVKKRINTGDLFDGDEKPCECIF